MKPANPFLPGAEKPTSHAERPATLEWYAKSVSGTKKTTNDDSLLIFASGIDGATILEPEGKHSLAYQDLVFCVSDGMGGGNAGNIASKLLLDVLSSLIPRTFKTAAAGFHPDYLSHLTQAIQAVHLAVNAEAHIDEKKKGMAATLALAWFTPENLYLGNVGDSRIYIHQSSDDQTKQLTEDHTFAWKKMNREEITEREYRAHPRRSILYEVIGGGHNKVNPTVASIPYSRGDRFLICSDGLIDGLWQKHIHSAFLKKPSSTKSLAEGLISRAIANDGTDDTTLITITVS